MKHEVLDDEDVWKELQEEDQVQVNAAVSSSCKRRLSCFAHSLQLAVGDGLKETGRCVKIHVAFTKAAKSLSLSH